MWGSQDSETTLGLLIRDPGSQGRDIAIRQRRLALSPAQKNRAVRGTIRKLIFGLCLPRRKHRG